jgi:hypothetical protein
MVSAQAQEEEKETVIRGRCFLEQSPFKKLRSNPILETLLHRGGGKAERVWLFHAAQNLERGHVRGP